MDVNLNILKREILEYLESSGFAVFHSGPGALEGLPMVLWDVEQYPDFQMFLETAKKTGTAMILFATREFESEDIDEAMEQIEDCELERDERRDLESRLRQMRGYAGVTCSLELAFDHDSRLYVYEVRPDWYDDFLGIEEEIAAHLPAEEEMDDDSLGGYLSRN